MRLLSILILVASASLVTPRGLLSFGNSQHVLSDAQSGGSIPGKNPLVYCESPDDYLLNIDYIKVTPNPPLIGQKFEIEANGTLRKNVTEGSYIHVQVSFGFIKLIDRTFGLCDQAGNVNLTCPIEKGVVAIKKEAEIPKEAPPGQYTIRAAVYTEDDEEITCFLGEKIPMHR